MKKIAILLLVLFLFILFSCNDLDERFIEKSVESKHFVGNWHVTQESIQEITNNHNKFEYNIYFPWEQIKIENDGTVLVAGYINVKNGKLQRSLKSAQGTWEPKIEQPIIGSNLKKSFTLEIVLQDTRGSGKELSVYEMYVMQSDQGEYTLWTWVENIDSRKYQEYKLKLSM